MSRNYPYHYRDERALLLPRKQFTTSHMRRTVNRVHRKVVKKTTAERARLQEKQAAERSTYHEALEEAWTAVMEQAERLRDRFGCHSVDYYYEELIQHSRKAKSKRSKINLWNAFTRLEAQQVNTGMYPNSIVYT
jgi:hypothetical protein